MGCMNLIVMNKMLRKLVALLLCLGLGACEMLGLRPLAPVEQEEAAAAPATVLDEPVHVQESSSAVSVLLADSREQLSADNYGSASRSVERALRLQPKNPRLWHQLALIRFQEENWQQVITLARKSNSLSGDSDSLQRANRELIQRASRRLQR